MTLASPYTPIWKQCRKQMADKAQAWNEYRAHGGKLDFTAWEEKLEREAK